MKKWLKMTLVVEPVLVDALADFLVGVIGAGVEVDMDEQTYQKTVNGFLEQENISTPERRALLSQVEDYASELAEIFTVEKPQLSWEEIEEEDWGANWKAHFTPFALTDNLVIAPTWEKYRSRGSEKVLVMDPGMAFGTGHHATTALVVQFLEQEMLKRDGVESVLDVGCGTGILGMAAALFGAKKVYGIDNDPIAVQVAGENCEINNLAKIMKVSGQALADVSGEYDLVVANIIHDVLLKMAPELFRVTGPGKKLILSGILREEQADSVKSHYENHGFVGEERRDLQEWSALLLRRVA